VVLNIASQKPVKRKLRLNNIRLDGDTQPRCELDRTIVSEYADAYSNGVSLPPLTVVHDGSSYWLADGFHRRFGADRAGLDRVPCEVYKGTLYDARWLSYAANQTHGLRRTNDDKRRAVQLALKHPNAAEMSDRLIAEHVGVSNDMVSRYRKVSSDDTSPDQDDQEAEPLKRTGRDGKKYPVPKPHNELGGEGMQDTGDTEDKEDISKPDIAVEVRGRILDLCAELQEEFEQLDSVLIASILEACAVIMTGEE
jgi:hypothetical protein